MASLVSQARFNINWQWPAIEMQYERLMARASLPLERMFYEHMRTVADMDFLVIMLRRFLRTVELVRRIPSDGQPQLKLRLKVFHSRWGNLTDVRNALEHFDTTNMFPVPMTSIPALDASEAQFVFMWPGGNLEVNKLFEDARSILKAVLGVIEPLEAERDARDC